MVSNLKKVNVNPRIRSFSDKQKQYGAEGLKGEPGGGGGGEFPGSFTNSSSGPGGGFYRPSNASDIFSLFSSFGRGRGGRSGVDNGGFNFNGMSPGMSSGIGKRQKKKGNAVEVPLKVSLEDLYTGKQKN